MDELLEQHPPAEQNVDISPANSCLEGQQGFTVLRCQRCHTSMVLAMTPPGCRPFPLCVFCAFPTDRVAM